MFAAARVERSDAPRLSAAGLAPLRAGWLLPAVLSVTAGAVDVTGFLALDGLFTAHVTGNLVILAAHYITGRFCAVGPMLAVPVFITVLAAVALACREVAKAGYSSRRVLLILQAALLAACLVLGVAFGPFADADQPLAVLVGMLAVMAMATQNALVRQTLPGTPSTAVMTTDLTLLVIDTVTLAGNWGKSDDRAKARHRVGLTLPCVIGFVVGCGAGALLEVRAGLWALAVPVALAVLAVLLGELWSDGTAEQKSHDKDQGGA